MLTAFNIKADLLPPWLYGGGSAPVGISKTSSDYNAGWHAGAKTGKIAEKATLLSKGALGALIKLYGIKMVATCAALTGGGVLATVIIVASAAYKRGAKRAAAAILEKSKLEEHDTEIKRAIANSINCFGFGCLVPKAKAAARADQQKLLESVIPEHAPESCTEEQDSLGRELSPYERSGLEENASNKHTKN